MPLVASHSDRIAKLKKVMRVQEQIKKLEQKLAALLADETAGGQNDYSLTVAQVKKAARNLHARAKKKIAEGSSKEFKGDIEAIL